MIQNNIKPLVVSYNTAQLLKDLGYNVWSEFMYTEYPFYDGKPIDEDEEFELKFQGKESEIKYRTILYKMDNRNKENGGDNCSAPELFDVIEWLRLNFGIVVAYEPIISDGKIKWASRIIKTTNNTIIKTMAGNPSNELEHALDYNVRIVLLELKKDERKRQTKHRESTH